MRKNKGFTLIELMIVIAIIAIIAAIAIPNLMQSRLRANEATAVTCVRNYGTAQVTFQLGAQASFPNNADKDNSGLNGFADNYRNLFYGNPRTTPVGGGIYDGDTARNLALISQAHADAFIENVGGEASGQAANASPLSPPSTPVVYQGYHFSEDDAMYDTSTSGGPLFVANYAMLACPANSSTTGNNVFWMDSENSVMRRGLNPNLDQDGVYTAISGDTPLDPAKRENWSSL